MKKYLALLLAVMLVFSCALPAVSAVTPSDNVELTEDTSSEPEGFADPSSEPTPVNPCAHENKEFVEAQEPTCTDTGNVAYYHCPDCDSNLDENDNVLETVELPTAPHVPTGEMYNADYTPLNCTPFVRQYGILLGNGVFFYAKGSTEQTIHSGIQEAGDRNHAGREIELQRNLPTI